MSSVAIRRNGRLFRRTTLRRASYLRFSFIAEYTMGSVNQLLFVQRHEAGFKPPFFEVGSKDYGNTQDLRSLFAGKGEYVGIDMEEGKGVDHVLDLTLPFDEIDAKLGGKRFGTIFCISVLEHCAQPFVMAENLTRLLAPGGTLCVSAPFAFQYHPYPADYWRFSQDGIRQLFSKLTFDLSEGAAATARTGDFRPLDQYVAQIPFGTRYHWKRGRFVRGLVAKFLYGLGKIGVLSWLTGYKYVLAPTDVMMIGRKPA